MMKKKDEEEGALYDVLDVLVVGVDDGGQVALAVDELFVDVHPDLVLE
jgi:hypothetical protein